MSGLHVELLFLMLRRPAALRFSTLLLLNFPLLALLKLLRLLSMFLLHLIQLLLLAALELLLPRLIRPLTFQFLLLLDVPLLHFLALRILPLAHLFKFSLLLLVEPRIDARGVRGPRGRRTVFEGTSVICRRFPRTIRFPRIFKSAVRKAGSARGHRATTVELARPWSGGNVWTTVVDRSQQSAVAAGGLLMLRLLGSH